MKRPILLIDSNYLCYRAHYSTGTLSYGDKSTGVIYGFLRDIVDLQDRFQPEAFCFCFDFGKNLRKLILPDYKDGRPPMPDEFKEQVRNLRKLYLRQLGYRNIFYQRGYEADDLIGHICLSDMARNKFIIVSGDHDMYQLLSKRVLIFNPGKKRAVTEDSFSREYGISPLQFVDCKAIAGCKTDNIKGVKGVGEKTAARFLNGTLGPTSKAFNNIVTNNKVWQANRSLVKLPFPGVEMRLVKPDKLRVGAWEDLAEKLGMESMKGKAPVNKKKGFGIF